MISVLAPAKVNLTLRVLSKRPDGYHEIQSLVQKIGLYDRITLAENPKVGIQFTCSDPALPTDSKNLAYRAAEIFQKKMKFDRGVRIHLEKKIPYGAGLGGGSSDAAAVLLGLPLLWDRSMVREDLLRMAEMLGSDVPLFLHSSPALIRGRGEVVEPVDIPLDAVYVIVYPGFTVSTAWAYSNFRLTKIPGNYTISELYGNAGGKLPPDRWGDLLVNDLETCVVQRYPEIARAKELLLRFGAKASMMSGSGSAVFGLFEDSRTAENAAQRMAGREFRAWTALPIFS
jgi:4-diphosphocytidyl-2-C-methyl-D-erythritol kinase